MNLSNITILKSKKTRPIRTQNMQLLQPLVQVYSTKY